jgi:TonB dependent receptor
VNLFALTDNTGTADNQQRPNLIGDPFAGVSHKFSQAAGGAPWINPAAFAQPAPGTFGDFRRNQIYGPGFASVDLSVFKNIPITERVKLQLRAEMFNLFNRVNLVSGSGAFSLSGGGIANDTAGDFFGAPGIGPGEAFNMQLAGKIIF